MKISTLPFLIIAVMCFLFFPQESQAQTPQTSSFSDITFDDATGIVSGYGYTAPDYQTGYYYNRAGAGAKILDSAGNQKAINQVERSGTTVEVRLQTTANANEQYTIKTGHYLFATYYVTNYWYNGYYTSGYRDPMFYGRYEGQGINAYTSYNFHGWGPETMRYSTNVTLGQTYKTVTIGGPHHLKVITDRTVTDPEACGRAHKFIDFKIVDANNRGVGKLTISEEPKDLVDTCSGLSVVMASCSSFGVNDDSTFTDSLRTGCPDIGTPTDSCGFSFGNRWRWCSTFDAGFVVNLAWMYYDVRHSYIKVDGQLDMTDGEYKYP
jgi:hypothetical protein